MICSPLNHQKAQGAQIKYSHLASLKLADEYSGEGNAPVDILVGSDQYWNLVTGEVVRGESGPTAMNTKLGWVLSGPVEGGPEESTSSVNLVCSTHVLKCVTLPAYSNQILENELKKFWELQSLGIQPNESSVYENFTDTISYKNGRYEVHLPWKSPHQLLPDNYVSSLHHFHPLYNRLKQTPAILEEYDSVIKDQLKKGIIEQVDSTWGSEVGKVHYLPHHAVMRRDKQTMRLRIVYNALAKSGGVSLNCCLYTGPSMSKNIFDILLRFQSFKTALIGDIEKAFLMVVIAEEDRDAVRYLWVDDITSKNPKIVVLRFARVVFGISSCPFLLNATIDHHICKYEPMDPQFVEKFLNNIYVDDLSIRSDDVLQTYELYLKSKLRLAEGGFNLRKFMSNSKELMSKINANESNVQGREVGGVYPQCAKSLIDEDSAGKQSKEQAVECGDESYTKSTIGSSTTITDQKKQKILGLRWNPEEDYFVFDLKDTVESAKRCEPTKRNIVSGQWHIRSGWVSVTCHHSIQDPVSKSS